MSVLLVIPARYASTRFPKKPLARIGRISLIERVYRQAIQAQGISQVVVATDHDQIHHHVISFGGKSIMTSPHHSSGTSRCAEVYKKINQPFDYIINLQGDEPFIDPKQIELLASSFHENIQLATLVKPMPYEKSLLSPHIVKVVISKHRKALYFSRSLIPHIQHHNPNAHQVIYYKHIGMYGYQAHILREITTLATSSLEQTEDLEQLRWLENGYSIHVVQTDQETLGIDTPEDLQQAHKWLSDTLR